MPLCGGKTDDAMIAERDSTFRTNIAISTDKMSHYNGGFVYEEEKGDQLDRKEDIHNKRVGETEKANSSDARLHVTQDKQSLKEIVAQSQKEIVAPDGGWGWVVCFACFMECLLFDGTFYTFGIIFLELTESFNSNKESGAWISSIGFGVCFTTGPIISVMINRMGYRTVTIIGSLAACVGLVMSSFANSIQFLYFSYGIVVGIGYGMVYAPSIIAVTVYFDKKRSLATGLSLCGNGLGVFVMSPVTEWLLQNYSWRGTFIIQGALLLNGILCGLVYLPLKSTTITNSSVQEESGESENPYVKKMNTALDRGDKVKPSVNGATQAKNASEKETLELEIKTTNVSNNKHDVVDSSSMKQSQSCFHVKRTDVTDRANAVMDVNGVTCSWTLHDIFKHTKDYKKDLISLSLVKIRAAKRTLALFLMELFDFSLMKNIPFCLYVISSFLFQLSYYIPFVYLPDLANIAGMSTYEGAWLLSSIGVSNIVSRALFGVVSDKVNRLMVYSGCVLVSGLAIMAKPLAGYFGILLSLSVIFGLCQGLSTLLITILVADLVGSNHVPTGLGIRNLFSGVASLVGPPLCGWIFDMTRNYDLPFYFFGAVTSLSGAMLFVIPCINRRSKEHTDAKLDLGN